MRWRRNSGRQRTGEVAEADLLIESLFEVDFIFVAFRVKFGYTAKAADGLVPVRYA